MTDLLLVVEPGLYTTIQDLGRPNAVTAGVPAGGAMDRFAHSAGNLLVGNDAGAATLECTISGPALTAVHSCLIAVTGADFEPRINGDPMPMWKGVFVSPGDRITFEGRRKGARTYVAVAGGFQGDRWLGSLSTYVLAPRGGKHGRILMRGDLLAAPDGLTSPAVAGRELRSDLRPDYSDTTLHVIPGPHMKRLAPDSRRRLFDSTFSVSRNADRMGYRLDGPALVVEGDELLSFGLTVGAIQVTPSGLPILLMADHQTAGGYPVVATVITASMRIAAQLAPGTELRFAETSLEEAQAMRRTQMEVLTSLRG